MPRNLAHCLIVCALAVVLVAVTWTGMQANEVRAMLADVLPPKEPEAVQTYTETVETQSGRTITVTTTRLDGESAEDFAKRHDEAVQSAKEL